MPETAAVRNRILSADPAARAKALRLLLILGSLGALAIWFVHVRLQEIHRLADVNLPAAIEQMLRLIRIVAWVGAAGAAAVAGSLWMLAGRIRRAEQFPPPGTLVVRRVRVRTGRDALAIAWAVRATAAAFVLLAVALAWLLPEMAARLLR